MLAKPAIYLDSNAGAPLSSKAREALLPFFDSGSTAGLIIPNPSSTHRLGRQSKRWLSESRERVAQSLGLKKGIDRIAFTSSGTEANQWVIRAVLEPRLERGDRPHWILTPAEHESVLSQVEWLKRRGGSASLLPVDSEGRVDAAALASLWTPQTALVSVLWVNNETGVVQDACALADAVHARGALLHLDAAQAWGKIPVDAESCGADFLTLSGHKIGALAGTGAVWAKAEPSPLGALFHGKQEQGRRGGTENLLGLITLGAAASGVDPAAWGERVAPLRDRLQSELLSLIPGARINGAGAPRVANTLNIAFDGIASDSLLMALDMKGYCVSSGAACASGVPTPSHVLQAMGQSEAQARSAIRISLPDPKESGLNWEMLHEFGIILSGAVERLRMGKGGV